MCFIHYESSSPFLSAKAKENEQNILTGCATPGSAYERRCVTNKTVT